jgi:hypothetical protein
MELRKAATVTEPAAGSTALEVSHKRHDQYQQNLGAIFHRFLATSLTMILLVTCLLTFSKIGGLDKWKQRAFSALAILLTGSMSLCIGSLLGYLGPMIRWLILAGARHRAEDVVDFLFRVVHSAVTYNVFR